MADASIYIADTGNNRIVERLIPDLSYVDSIDAVQSQMTLSFIYPNLVASNSTHLFVFDFNASFIYQFLLSDLSYVNRVDVSSYSIYGICADDNYLYTDDDNTDQLVRLNASTLSFVDSSTLYCTGSRGLTRVEYFDRMCSDGVYLYIIVNDIIRFPIANIGDSAPGPAVITSYDPSAYSMPWRGYVSGSSDNSICVSGNYLFVTQTYQNLVYKFDKSDLSFVDVTEVVTATATITSTPSLASQTLYCDLASAPTGGSFSVSDVLTFSPSGATAVCTYYYDSGTSWTLEFDTVTGTPTPQDTVTCIATGVSATFIYIDYYVSFDYSGDIIIEDEAFMPALGNAGYTYVDDTTLAPNITVDFYLYSDEPFVFPQSGDTLLQYSCPAGTGDTQFDLPAGIASDGTSIYIADTNNGRIIKRSNSTLDYESQYACQSAAAPYDVMFGDSNIYVSTPASVPPAVEKVSVPSLSYDLSLSSFEGLVSVAFGSPKAICNDGTYLYFITLPSVGDEILFKGTIGSGITNLSNVFSVAIDDGFVTNPHNIITDGNLLFYIVDGAPV